jgi:hypothetical protein
VSAASVPFHGRLQSDDSCRDTSAASSRPRTSLRRSSTSPYRLIPTLSPEVRSSAARVNPATVAFVQFPVPDVLGLWGSADIQSPAGPIR